MSLPYPYRQAHRSGGGRLCADEHVAHAHFLEIAFVVVVILLDLLIRHQRVGVLSKLAQISVLENLAAVEQNPQLRQAVLFEILFSRQVGHHFELAVLLLELLALRPLRPLLKLRIALQEVVKIVRVRLVVSVYLIVADGRFRMLLADRLD